MNDRFIKCEFYLIDDNKIDLRIHEKLLGYANVAARIFVFQNGKDALHHIEQRGQTDPCAIILLDIQMPRMNGFQFVEAFKKLPLAKRTSFKIIMVSSTIDPEELRAVQADELDLLFLPKPLNPASIQSIMQEWQNTLPL